MQMTFVATSSTDVAIEAIRRDLEGKYRKFDEKKYLNVWQMLRNCWGGGFNKNWQSRRKSILL